MNEHELDAVRQLMAAAGISSTGPLTARRLAAGRSNWTFRISDGDMSWLLRRPPSGGLTPSAHDVAREHRITAALHRSQVPVAEPLLLCDSGSPLEVPFTISTWVDGTTVQTSSDLEQISDSVLLDVTTELVAQLAGLHAVDHREVGLGDFARSDAYAERQVKRWRGQWERVRVEDSEDATVLGERLAELVPGQSAVCVVHGDYRIDNVILTADDPSTVLAIVDWELSTLGDPVADVALMAVYRHPALSALLGVDAAWASGRLPDEGELAAMYARVSGSSLPNWEFYLALGYYKLAVIAQGIDHRFRAGATQGAGFDAAGSAVPDLLAAGRRALKM